MTDRPAALAGFGPLVAWPLADGADAALELGRLTDAAAAALKAAFAQRGVVPRRPADSGLRIEYALPLPGGGARQFCFDLGLRARAVCEAQGRRWIEARPRIFAEVVSRADLVSWAAGSAELDHLWQEIAEILGRLGTPASGGAYQQTALSSAQVVFGAPLPLPAGPAGAESLGAGSAGPGDQPGHPGPLDTAAVLARMTDAAAATLSARSPPGAAAPLRRSQHALTLRRSLPGTAEGEAQRLLIDIELQAAPAPGGFVAVPRLFGEGVLSRRAGAEDLLLLAPDGDALTAFLDETRMTLATLRGPPDAPDAAHDEHRRRTS